MPIGAFKINGIAKRFAVAVSAEVIRRKVNIAANGNAQVSTAQSQFNGSSAVFDGTGDFLRIYNPGTLAFDSNDFTIECWVRPTGTKKDFPLIIHNYIDGQFDATGSWFLADRHNSASTKFSFWVDNFNGQASPMLTSTTSVSTNTWYHIAIVRSGTTFRMFVNGTQEATATFSGSFDSNLSNNWGVGDWNSGSVNGYTGNIDEIRVSNTARYTTNFTAPTQPFVNDDNTRLLIHANGTNASTFFEDDNGASIQSSSGRTARSIQVNGNTKISTVEKTIGSSSAVFDGDSDYLFLTGDYRLTGNFTIEFWAYWNNNSGIKNLLTIGNESSGRLGIFSNGSTIGIDTFGGNNPSFNVSGQIATGTWYHIALVRNGSTITLYRNGVSIGTGTSSATLGNANGVYIGTESSLIYEFNGYIDEVRVSDVARYTANFTTATTPFVDDINTLFLLHFEGANNSTVFVDDVGGRTQKSLRLAGNAQVSTAQSKFGGASASFDGSGDYLDIPNINNEFTFGNSEFTIEFWIRFNSTTFGFVYDQRPPGTNGFFPSLSWFSSAVRYYVNGSDRIVSNTLSTGVWYHVAIVKTGNDTKMYINGTQQGSTWTDSTSLGSGAQILFAAETFNYGTNALNAYYDEIRISKSARYTANFTAPTEPFVNDANTLLLSHMDGTNASTVFRDDNGAVANRQPKYITAFGNAQISTAQSQFGGSSALFDGTGDRLLVADTSLLFWNTQPYSVEYWCRVNSFTSQAFNDPTIIGNMDPSSNGCFWSFGPDNDGDLTFKYFNGNDTRIVSTSSKMSTGIWYHCAAVINSNTIKIYLNGTEVGSGSISGTPQFSTSYGGLNIGWGNGSASYNGHLDEVRISNTARYTANFTPSTTPFVNDANTRLLIHANGANASTLFLDDTGSRSQKGVAAVGNAQLSTAQSQFGGSSALFDGTGDNLTISPINDFLFGTGDFTIEMRFRTTSTQEFQIVWDGRPASSFTYLYPVLYIHNPSGTGIRLKFFVNGADAIQSDVLSTNTWYHAALVRTAGSSKLYLNGTQVGSTYSDTNNYTTTRSSVFLGGGGAGGDTSGSFIGNIDEVRVSNLARYTGSFTPSTSPFVNDANTILLLHMDGTNASTVFFDDNGVAPYTPT